MDQRVKKLWIDALRSGEYNQGTGALRPYSAFGHKADSYCCLGVLCELYRRENDPESQWIPLPGDGERFLDEEGVLPREVGEWAELLDEGGWAIDDPVVNGETLTSLNDGGKDFSYIADQIQQYL